MSNLFEQATALRETLRIVEEQEVEALHLGRLRTRQQQIRDALERLETVHTSMVAMRANGLVTTSLPKASSALKGKAPELLSALQTDWRSFAAREDIRTHFSDRVVGYADRLENALRMSWYAHVDADLPDVREDFLVAFSDAGFDGECGELRSLKHSISRARATLPTSIEQLQELVQLKAAMRGVWESLSGVPKGVVTFLRRASAREATFTDLTPEIQSWLRERDMLSKLRIGLG